MSEICTDIIDFLRKSDIHSILILTDRNVDSHYPNYFKVLDQHFFVKKIVVPAGDSSKTLKQATDIWQMMLENALDKDVFVLNFGGGMICDLGGFVASTYKRGVRFANFPTSLLAMIDASIGGKNGVNFNNIKNCIGLIHQPSFTFSADTQVLKTLPEVELKSGFGEMIKYALIDDANFFNQLIDIDTITYNSISPEWISKCVSIKQKIVNQDPEDKHLRHILNFGHTVGHAIESTFISTQTPIPHGVAVAIGMIYESYLSHCFGTLSVEEFSQINTFIRRHFTIPKFSDEIWHKIQTYMLQDKKNCGGFINLTLLEHIGKAVPDFLMEGNTLMESLRQI